MINLLGTLMKKTMRKRIAACQAGASLKNVGWVASRGHNEVETKCDEPLISKLQFLTFSRLVPTPTGI